MNKHITGIMGLTLLVYSGIAQATEPLPNYATPAELASASPADWQLNDQFDILAAPPKGLRLPAEYEPTQAVVMTYAAYPQFVKNLARAIAGANAKVLILGGPASIQGVPQDLYKPLDIDYNTIWSRDFGPVAINELTGDIAIVDPIYRHYAYRKADDRVPENLANEFAMENYKLPLILDGGNLMVDRRGHLYMTTRTYDWNRNLSPQQVDRYLIDYFGVKQVHALPYAKTGSRPADGTGHIDMFAKILDDCKVLVTETKSQPYVTPLNQTAEYFANTECAPGQNWQVFRVKGWSSGRVWYTYTNSLIVNDSVIIPSYRSDDSSAAREVYRRALPDHKLVFVNSDRPIVAAGAIHCTTKEIPAVASF